MTFYLVQDVAEKTGAAYHTVLRAMDDIEIKDDLSQIGRSFVMDQQQYEAVIEATRDRMERTGAVRETQDKGDGT